MNNLKPILLSCLLVVSAAVFGDNETPPDENPCKGMADGEEHLRHGQGLLEEVVGTQACRFHRRLHGTVA